MGQGIQNFADLVSVSCAVSLSKAFFYPVLSGNENHMGTGICIEDFYISAFHGSRCAAFMVIPDFRGARCPADFDGVGFRHFDNAGSFLITAAGQAGEMGDTVVYAVFCEGGTGHSGHIIAVFLSQGPIVPHGAVCQIQIDFPYLGAFRIGGVLFGFILIINYIGYFGSGIINNSCPAGVLCIQADVQFPVGKEGGNLDGLSISPISSQITVAVFMAGIYIADEHDLMGKRCSFSFVHVDIDGATVGGCGVPAFCIILRRLYIYVPFVQVDFIDIRTIRGFTPAVLEDADAFDPQVHIAVDVDRASMSTLEVQACRCPADALIISFCPSTIGMDGFGNDSPVVVGGCIGAAAFHG